jgi:purine-nucleoside phosphorylase
MQITYIKTGIGAPVLMDALLSLGVTRCKKIIFIGSVGSLDKNIHIGDIVIPEFSICGDGASRYIASDLLNSDVFGEKVFPDDNLSKRILAITSNICIQNNVKWHIGHVFSIDTIFTQYAHIDEIIEMGCDVIEMETAAAFRAAKIADISIAAILSVSDNTVINKSLISGRTEEEMLYRKFVRRELFPKIIHEAFS